MESKLLLLSLSFVVVLAFAQDTLLQETDVSNKAKTSTSCAANLSRLEDRLGHRIRDTERRIIHRFDHKFRLLNQSAAVAHLQDIVDFYTAEMDQARQTNKEQTEQIRVLKTHNSHKQRELHRMKTSLERLKKSVATLNELVEELVQSKNQPATGTVATGSADRGRTGSTTGTGSENEVDQGDAPPSTGVPFKPLFPTGMLFTIMFPLIVVNFMKARPSLNFFFLFHVAQLKMTNMKGNIHLWWDPCACESDTRVVIFKGASPVKQKQSLKKLSSS